MFIVMMNVYTGMSYFNNLKLIRKFNLESSA